MPEYKVNKWRGVYKRAIELYNEEKYQDSATFLDMVVTNDPENFNACYYFGTLLYSGKGVSKNVKRAFEMFMVAAQNKVTEAQYRVGMCYLEGIGINQDSTQAVAWFSEAAKYAHPLSQYYLGLAYMKGEGINKDIPKAAQWLVHAAKEGVVDAQREAAKCYEELGKKKGAAVLYLAAAENNDPYSQKKIADCYEKGDGALQSSELALHYYELAAENGNDEAQVTLGNKYSSGQGVPQDMKKALALYNQAAKAGNGEAQNRLAECYHLGDGIIKDDVLAVEWWTKAANAGNTTAMIHLAENLTEPNNSQVKPDLVTAKYWWTKAAESGDAYAMYRLGDCYEKGLGVSNISLEDAFKWYRLGAQNGDQDAIDASQRFTKSLTGKVKLKKM